ncbi:MAG TPA: ABC transporter substrate-binding protein [Candidatus Binatia bacterium]|nr:ABC transporter substrate-binding protein [Candidatus Binatia bacterium]
MICAIKRAAAPLVLIAVILLAVAVVTEAQQQAKTFKVGWLESATTDRGSRLGDIFLRRLAELGFVEGKNIAFEYRSANNKLDRLPALVDELVRLNVDVLLTSATPATIAAKNATKTIPIVFMQLAVDPVAAGFVDSLARPGGNITGLTNIAAELAGKRLEILKETVPKLSRVALMWEPKNAGSAQTWKESQLPAKELGLQLHSMEVSSADQFDGAFKEAIKARSAALALTPMVLAANHRKEIVELAAKSRLPAVYYRDSFAESGGLMSYGADLADHFRRRRFHRKNFEGKQTRRPSCRAAEEIRVHHQSKNCHADRPDDSAERAVEGG